MTKTVVACWHHADEDRLLNNLQRGRIDLYGRREVTDKGTNARQLWLSHPAFDKTLATVPRQPSDPTGQPL